MVVEAAHLMVVVVEICWLLVCLAMAALQPALGVLVLLLGVAVAVEVDGDLLVKAGETPGPAMEDLVMVKVLDNPVTVVDNPVLVVDNMAVDNPVLAVTTSDLVMVVPAVDNNADSAGHPLVPPSPHPAHRMVAVELHPVEALHLHFLIQNALMEDPLALPVPLVGTLALLSVQPVPHHPVIQNVMVPLVPLVPLAVYPTVGVHLEVKAGEHPLQTVVVGQVDNKVGAVAKLAGDPHLVEIIVLKVTLVLKVFTLNWVVKLFKPLTQFLSGTMLMAVQPVLTLELKQKLTEPLLLFLTLKCPEHTTLVPFLETQRSL